MSEGLFVGPVAGLVAQDLGKPGTFGDARLYRRVGILLVLAHLALCLPLDVPGRTVIEVPPPVLRHDRALPLRTFGPDLLREPADLGFVVPACDPVPPLLERRSPLFQLDNFRVWQQTFPELVGDHVSRGTGVTGEADVCEQSEELVVGLFFQKVFWMSNEPSR